MDMVSKARVKSEIYKQQKMELGVLQLVRILVLL